MDTILVHLGGPAPKFQDVCIKQIQQFSKGHIFCENEEKRHWTPKLVDAMLSSEYLNGFGMNGFWRWAMLRLYVVERIMEVYDLKSALHIENDNLIYDDPEHTMMAEYCGDSVGLTQLTDNELSAGVMYVGSHGALATLTEKMTGLVKQGLVALEAKYGTTMLHEMRLLKIIHDENPGIIKLLPTLPAGNAHIFDCASWGQWVGGTFQDPGIRYAGNHHIVGRELIKGKYDVTWKDKRPYVDDTPLFNLHIHSKDLERWKSYV
jgi:hypothetical protein